MRAKAVGAGDIHILRRHILPAVLPLMLANMVLVVSLAILDESIARLPRPRRPDRHQLGPDAELRLRARRDQRRSVVGAARRPGFAIVWVVLGTTLLGTALEDARQSAAQAPPPRGAGERRRPRPRRSSQPPPVERGADAPILRVRDLTHRVRQRAGPAARGRRRQLRPAPRRDARPGGGVGLRQDDDGARPAAAAAARRHDRRRLGVVRRRGPRRPGRVRAARVPLDAAVARLPGRDERAQPGADGRATRSPRRSACTPRTPRRPRPPQRTGELLERVGISRRRAQRVPAHVLRRHAPARDDRAGARLRPGRHRGRRADDRARRDDPGPDPRAARRHRPRLRDGDHPRHPRPRRRGPGLRPGRGDVRRRRGRGERRGHALPRRRSTRTRSSCCGSFPDLAHPDRPLRGIPGSPPRLDAMPPGCRFAPRCPHAFDRCHVERPPEYPAAGGRASCFLLDPAEMASARAPVAEMRS